MDETILVYGIVWGYRRPTGETKVSNSLKYEVLLHLKNQTVSLGKFADREAAEKEMREADYRGAVFQTFPWDHRATAEIVEVRDGVAAPSTIRPPRNTADDPKGIDIFLGVALWAAVGAGIWWLFWS